MPCLPVHPRELPNQKERMDAWHSTRLRMAKLIARMRLYTKANTNAPAAADSTLLIEDTVLVYRDSPISKWVGPLRVIYIDEKAVSLIYDGKRKGFSIDRCKRYQVPMPWEEDEHGFTQSRLDNTITDNSLYAARPVHLEEGYCNINSDGVENTFVERVLRSSDQRIRILDLEAAKKKEVDGLIKRQI